MSEQTNPQTESTAITDEELEQANGGSHKPIPGRGLIPGFYAKVCCGYQCASREKALKTNRVCMGCPYVN